NDFAVSVAKTALWIAESQTLRETERIVNKKIDFLPLRTQANITEGNALRMDWNEVAPREDINYIMGNPPFVGHSEKDDDQKYDIDIVMVDDKGKSIKNSGKVDYVSGWYKKSLDYINCTNIRCALVSTNSICQGQQPPILWKYLFEHGVHIDFARRTFKWDSDSTHPAGVSCIIVGFSTAPNKKDKVIYYEDGTVKTAKNINGYLIDYSNIFVKSNNRHPVCDMPKFITGNRPADGGNLIIEAEDYEQFIEKEPEAKKWIRPLICSDEYIKGKQRWCLWLVGITPHQLRSLPEVYKRVVACKQDRLKGADDRKKLAEKPHLFREQLEPDNYLVVPRHSSENREYIPIGFLKKGTIPNDSTQIIPNAEIYHFGVLTSSVHMAWMRAVCGRLESRYRYSKDIVYNNFPWPSVAEEQKRAIETAAREILAARDMYPDSSLADLYDPGTMPPELRKAHNRNDEAVKKAYGYPRDITEAEIVADLMERYAALTK
ncbi:MAG: class I SAM-dependent DNA methyltransferase, partial [Abditibacteriota bacterium]|nr:class I SAM-dependent DNA methyltransferase [Abditibacteriota bacterium]